MMEIANTMLSSELQVFLNYVYELLLSGKTPKSIKSLPEVL